MKEFIFGNVEGCALETLLKMNPCTGIFWSQVQNGYTKELFFRLLVAVKTSTRSLFYNKQNIFLEL